MRTRPLFGFIGLLLLCTLSTSAASAGEYNTVMNIGDPLPAFKNLPTTAGETLSSADIKEDALVLVSLSNACPFSVGIEPDLKKLVDTFAGQSVKVVGLSFNANQLDQMPAIQKRAAEQNFNFTYARDESQALGRALGATVTPEFFVFNKERNLVYMGLLHNSPAMENGPGKVAYLRGDPSEFYVEDAVRRILSGTEDQITVRETSPYGCTVEYNNG